MATKPYGQSPIFTEETLPSGLRRNHSLKPDTWGRLNVILGSLRYTDVESGEETILIAGEHRIVPPEAVHFVEPLGKLEMRIDFFDRAPT